MPSTTVQTIPAHELRPGGHVDTAGDLNGLASGITTGSIVRVAQVNHVELPDGRRFVDVTTDRGERYAWHAGTPVDVHRAATGTAHGYTPALLP
jgi:hypothetical protein